MPTPAVLIVSASMGAGHDAAARELSRRLAGRGASVATVDFLSLPRLRQGTMLRGFYRALVGRAPAAYDLAMRQWARHPGFFERLTGLGAGSYERPLARRLAAGRPDVVVSTYNLAAQALGRLRRAGRIDVPVVSYVTDPGAHPYWVAAGADLHLAPLAVTAESLAGYGAARAEVVAPLVDPTPAAPGRRDEVRGRWGLGRDERVALVNGGSWGVGPAARTAGEVAAAGARPLVLCGRSDRLRQAVAHDARAVAVPWTDDMPGLLAAADVVVDNAGGTTCWEALAAGRPVVVHRPIAGHGRLNAQTLAGLGLVRQTTTGQQLAAAVRDVVPSPAAAAVFGQRDAAAVVASLW
jgi:UDP-N-acetylglucosamine:LPS N-acetylglucosamine transferase